MTTTELLTSALSCTGSDRDRWTLPAGTEVTVHHFTGPRWAVVRDGRVYRATAAAIEAATQ